MTTTKKVEVEEEKEVQLSSVGVKHLALMGYLVCVSSGGRSHNAITHCCRNSSGFTSVKQPSPSHTSLQRSAEISCEVHPIRHG